MSFRDNPAPRNILISSKKQREEFCFLCSSPLSPSPFVQCALSPTTPPPHHQPRRNPLPRGILGLEGEGDEEAEGDTEAEGGAEAEAAKNKRQASGDKEIFTAARNQM